jgi:uncharacterized membrane protein
VASREIVNQLDPFLVEAAVGHFFAGTVVPIRGVGEVAFYSVKVGVYP